MSVDFPGMINKYRARMRLLRAAFDRDGSLHAVSIRDPGHSLLLSRNPSSEAPWRVTSFREREPVGHREYDLLDGGGPTQNALGEFAGFDWQLIPRRPLTALCVRTRVIGTGNSFEVLIPLSEISAEGQSYRIDQGNREFVPFHLGIEPYTSQIIRMPPGFERYERYKAHEQASKGRELSILQHAFPENHLPELPFLWNRDYLGDKQVTLQIDRRGNLIRPAVRRLNSFPAATP